MLLCNRIKGMPFGDNLLMFRGSMTAQKAAKMRLFPTWQHTVGGINCTQGLLVACEEVVNLSRSMACAAFRLLTVERDKSLRLQ
jgi:hypothetical protein